ncbi:unnamed protein product [Linum trigynum]|uniref:Uncharacterized protein n=1 Tax=Linum trigynum TaxID=586398 RepID=A0AAV2E6T4_9ROSI
MGGSRKKVATSRKSIEKRQRQYFEQKRRQQRQQMGGLESFRNEKNIGEQNQKEPRSLDVLSLLNLSTISRQVKHADASPCAMPELSKVNASGVQSNFPKTVPRMFDDSFSPTDSLEIREGQQAPISPKKILFPAPENAPDVSNGIVDKSDFQETATLQKLSVFDLLADDGPNANSRSPVHEAHVTFSVDGLGSVGADTSVQAPPQSDRYASFGFFNPSKPVRQDNLKIHNELEKEVEVMIEDVDLHPSFSNLDFSKMDQLHGKLKKSSTLRDHGQLDGHYRNKTGSYSGKNNPLRKANVDIWDAAPTLLDENLVDEMEPKISLSSLPRRMDNESANFPIYGSMGLQDDYYEGSCLLRKKRNRIEEVDEYNISGEFGSFAPKYQAPESNDKFLRLREARQSPMGNAKFQPDWSSHSIEDPRDNLSLLSEESSTAASLASMDSSPSYSTGRPSRKQESAFDGLDTMYGTRNIYAEEPHKTNRGNSQKRGKAERPTLLVSNMGDDFDPLCKEKIGPFNDWPYEDGYRSMDTNKVSNPWDQDLNCTFPSHGHHARSSSSSKYGCSGDYLSSTFPEPSSSMKLHGSPKYPKVKLPKMQPEHSLDFETEGRTPNFCKNSDFFLGEQSFPKHQQTYCKTAGAQRSVEDIGALSDLGENGPRCMGGVKDGGTLETSSSANIPGNSDSSVDEIKVARRRQHDEAEEVPPACRSGKAEVKRKTVKKMDKQHCMVSSPQVMMLESYVFQLLRVQREARLSTP